ncbi:hypothetical protein B0H14DRAFT_3688461 [Mycena olivaceomarginata]|nr:hypothetical protein B0H14DRAFT_2576852 [Mycena olivaceomarginata]KAJ7892307.1 hypothetical protein B0H14DRAFT_3688461 [Mycena olivaceomarginata]
MGTRAVNWTVFLIFPVLKFPANLAFHYPYLGVLAVSSAPYTSLSRQAVERRERAWEFDLSIANIAVLIHSFPTREDPPSVSLHLPLVPHSLPASTTILHRPHLPIPSVHGFMAKVVLPVDRGVDGAELTKWKQAKAFSILESPAFINLDLQKNPRKAWFEMIVRKFTNYRNCVYCKSATAIPTSALANEKANPSLKFSSITSGCQLFAKENSESITAASHQHLLDTEIRPSAEPIRGASPHAQSRAPAGITVAPPLIVKHNNSPPPQLSTIQPPKSEPGPTGPLDIAVKRKAKKQPEGTEEHRKQYAKKPKLRLYRASSLEYLASLSLQARPFT